jgi:hypothetical protein
MSFFKCINIHLLFVYIKSNFNCSFSLYHHILSRKKAVYSDYLSDNYYLIHPSMAGAANCAKIRLTARKRWFGQEDAPELQTLSFNGRVRKAGQEFFSMTREWISLSKKLKLTYAYHLMFSRDEIDLNCLLVLAEV